ncbi:MAG: alpha/beta hydrolase family protein [Betaproteobacteria bacterium]|nr:alpha/beta hydrolase family protein [Betaproteobacteria bacterium]
MRFFAIILLSLFALTASAADYVREQKWADEVVPSIVVGDPVYLGPVNGHKFLALYTEAAKPKTAVIVVHGLGVHPDWNLIGVLRSGLAEQGYTTLSVQMPVLAADAAAASYSATFDEAAGRLKAAVEFLRGKGYRTIAIVSHSMGSRMSLTYLERNPAAPVKTWVAIGMPTSGGYGKVVIPVLDLYGANDLPAVLKGARRRADSFRVKGSEQIAVPQTDHFFNQRDVELVKTVKDYLDKVLADCMSCKPGGE